MRTRARILLFITLLVSLESCNREVNNPILQILSNEQICDCIKLREKDNPKSIMRGELIRKNEDSLFINTDNSIHTFIRATDSELASTFNLNSTQTFNLSYVSESGDNISVIKETKKGKAYIKLNDADYKLYFNSFGEAYFIKSFANNYYSDCFEGKTYWWPKLSYLNYGRVGIAFLVVILMIAVPLVDKNENNRAMLVVIIGGAFLIYLLFALCTVMVFVMIWLVAAVISTSVALFKWFLSRGSS